MYLRINDWGRQPDTSTWPWSAQNPSVWEWLWRATQHRRQRASRDPPGPGFPHSFSLERGSSTFLRVTEEGLRGASERDSGIQREREREKAVRILGGLSLWRGQRSRRAAWGVPGRGLPTPVRRGRREPLPDGIPFLWMKGSGVVPL